MTDRELAETICRALIMIVRAIAKRYDISMKVPDINN